MSTIRYELSRLLPDAFYELCRKNRVFGIDEKILLGILASNNAFEACLYRNNLHARIARLYGDNDTQDDLADNIDIFRSLKNPL